MTHSTDQSPLKGGQNLLFGPEKSDFLQVALDFFLSAVCSVLCWSSAEFSWLCYVRVFSTQPPRKDAAAQLVLCRYFCADSPPSGSTYAAPPVVLLLFHTNGRCAPNSTADRAIWTMRVETNLKSLRIDTAFWSELQLWPADSTQLLW